MALPVRENVSPLARLHEEIDRMFPDLHRPGFGPFREGAGRLPGIDVYEKDGNLVVQAELPGIDKKDVKVTYTENSVTIRGEMHQESEEKKEGYYRSERQYGSYLRTVPLPQPVKFEEAKAEYKDGVLTLTLPKAPAPQAETRTIPIEV